jgi:5'-nucleotidase / UDP-sugar diphosphatase
MGILKVIATILLLYLACQSLQAQNVVILHTNDLHSRLNGYGPESEYTPLSINDDVTRGGFSRIATVFKNEKSKHPEKVVILDAGDFLMGTFFHELEPETGFQLQLMGEMGYDAIAIGNHEFDFGHKRLAKMVKISSRNQKIPQLLLSNAVIPYCEATKDIRGLYSQGLIEKYTIIERNGIKIGVFALMGQGASRLIKGNAPITFTNSFLSAKRIVNTLRSKKVDIIIALSHAGVEFKDNEWKGEDIELAKNVSGIDIIIGGHSHTLLNEPIIINGTTIVQTGCHGQTIGKIEWYGNKNTKCSNIEIDDKILGDAIVQQKIDIQQEKLYAKILEPLGLRYNTPIFESSFPLMLTNENRPEKGNLGPFIADAILHDAKQSCKGDSHIAIIPAGMIRGNLTNGNSGQQTPADLFRTLSLGSGNDSVPGYALSRIYINGKELKRLVEVLLLAYQTGASRYIYYSGLKVKYDPKKPPMRSVVSIEIGDNFEGYTPINNYDSDKLYGLVANTYMLDFLFLIRKMSIGTIRITPKDSTGNSLNDRQMALLDFCPQTEGVQEGKEWTAVLNYSRSFFDLNDNGIPDVPLHYKMKVNPLYQKNSIHSNTFVSIE